MHVRTRCGWGRAVQGKARVAWCLPLSAGPSHVHGTVELAALL